MTRPQVDINFFSPESIADPFPLYEQVRAAGRVVWNQEIPGWMVVGFDDCWEILTDDGARFSSSINDNREITPWFEAPTMISTDGAEHHRLRGCLAHLFTRRAIGEWLERVEQVVDDLLAPLADGGSSYDLIAEFTMVPTIIVADMLGVPKERYEDFRRWSNSIVNGLSHGHEDPATRQALLDTSAELNAYLRDEIERHKRERPADLFTEMIKVSERGGMSDDEVRAGAVLLLTAGYETTAKLLSNALVAFERNPEQRKLLVNDPELMPMAIEEVLRWQSNVQAIPRVVAVDTELAGTQLRAGEVVYAMIAAANRDPSRWEQPERFDIQRPRQAHYGFGYGSHLCLGAWLARLEARIALQSLLRVAPNYSLRDIDLGPSFFTRGPERGFIDAGAPAGSLAQA